ncbi:MAG: GNAT family N-acetyltransferase [Gemmatimonadaceae bacterium]
MRVDVVGPEQLSLVRAVYADAQTIQRAQGSPVWPEFSDALILVELEAGHLFRVLDGDTLVGVFSVAYEDPAIWGQHERGEHIYLHRIARSAEYAGRGLLEAVLVWARGQCRAMGRAGLRMDTWASNTGLIDYYQRHGFRFLGTRRIGDDARLPPHYQGIELALLEEVYGSAGERTPPPG